MSATKKKLHRSSVKVVGVNGQISIGKQYAGRQVQIEEHGVGVWLVRTVTVVPDSEPPSRDLIVGAGGLRKARGV